MIGNREARPVSRPNWTAVESNIEHPWNHRSSPKIASIRGASRAEVASAARPLEPPEQSRSTRTVDSSAVSQASTPERSVLCLLNIPESSRPLIPAPLNLHRPDLLIRISSSDPSLEAAGTLSLPVPAPPILERCASGFARLHLAISLWSCKRAAEFLPRHLRRAQLPAVSILMIDARSSRVFRPP
jgi:hypothetical protein